MFDKIRSEHEESLEGEGQIDSEEPGVHGSSGRAEDENYIYSNNEDIGGGLLYLRFVYLIHISFRNIFIKNNTRGSLTGIDLR